MVTEDGERGRYRPVELGDALLVTVNAESATDAQRVVGAVVGRMPTELTATARTQERSGSDAPDDHAVAVVGAIIRLRREARGISLRAFARQCDLSPGHVSKIERGHANPSLEVLTRIVNELDLHDADLFGRPAQRDGRAHVVRGAEAALVPGDKRGEVRVTAQTSSATVVLGSGGPERFPQPTTAPQQVTTVVLAGSVEVRIENDLIQLQAGDTLIVPPLIAHSIRVTGGPDTRTAYITSGEPQADAST